MSDRPTRSPICDDTAASHGLPVGDAFDRLRSLSLWRLITTDSVAPQDLPPLPIEAVSIAPFVADAIHRLHHNQPLDDLSYESD